MKKITPDQAADVSGAYRPSDGDYIIGIDPVPLPLPQPIHIDEGFADTSGHQ